MHSGSQPEPGTLRWTSKVVLGLLTLHVGVSLPRGTSRFQSREGSLESISKDNCGCAAQSGSGEQQVEVVLQHNSEPILEQTTVPSKDLAPQAIVEGRLNSSKLLFSLAAIDSLSWIVGKAMQFESLQMAQKLNISYVKIALLLTTVEVAVEFLASSTSPQIYRWLQHSTTFTSRNLTVAALKGYGISCFIAIIVYPIMAILLYAVFEPSVYLLGALVAVQSFQYSYWNQIGDSLREMAQPHWLRTVQGLDLVFPGQDWSHGVLRRPASADSLAVYLQLSFLIISAVFGALYTVVKDMDIVRWTLVIVIAALNSLIFLLLYHDLDLLKQNIVDVIADDGKPLVLWVWKMAAYEQALIVLIIVVLAVPQQAYNALLAVLILDLDGFLGTAIVGVAALIVFVFLCVRIYRCSGSMDAPVFSNQTSNFQKGGRQFNFWLLAIGGILITLTGGTIGLYLIAGTVGIIISMLAFIMVRPFVVQFHTLVDGFLFLYDGVQASNVRLWVNIGTVIINAPLLALNWWAISGGLNSLGAGLIKSGEDTETPPEEQMQAAVVLFLSIAIIGVTLCYFTFLDPLCKEASLRRAVHLIYAQQTR